MPKKDAKPKGLEKTEETPAESQGVTGIVKGGPVFTAVAESTVEGSATVENVSSEASFTVEAAEAVESDSAKAIIKNSAGEVVAEAATLAEAIDKSRQTGESAEAEKAARDTDEHPEAFLQPPAISLDEALNLAPAIIPIEGAEADALNEQLTPENVEALDGGKTLIVEDDSIRPATPEETAAIDEVLESNQIEDFKIVPGANSVSPKLEPKAVIVASGDVSGALAQAAAQGAELDGSVEVFHFKSFDELKFLEESELKDYQESILKWAENENLAGELLIIVDLRGKANGDFKNYVAEGVSVVAEAGKVVTVHIGERLVFEGEAKTKPRVFIPGQWLSVLVKVEDAKSEAARIENANRRRRRYDLIKDLIA